MSYEAVAAEYYDANLHPTCADFRALSERAIDALVRLLSPPTTILEIGPGRSVLFDESCNPKARFAGSDVVMVDAAAGMLRYAPCRAITGCAVGAAAALPFASGSMDLVVASLGDPYNDGGSWAEVRRVLRPTGACIFTTPAHDWATSYRPMEGLVDLATAAFLLNDGRKVAVPSIILSTEAQIALLARHLLDVRLVEHHFQSELSTVLSSKTAAVAVTTPVITAYLVIPARDSFTMA